MKALAKKDFLVLHDSGSHSKDPKYWKSAIYSLASPFDLPHGGPS